MRAHRNAHHVWMWLGIVVLILLVSSGVAVRFIVAHAEPILRARVVETLATHFHGKVQLSRFDVSVVNGIQVTGNGLKIFGATDPNPHEPGIQPLIDLQEFRFQTSLHSLFRSPMHVDIVYVKGLELNIPPKEDRQEVTSLRRESGRVSIIVDKFVGQDTKLLINSANPNKAPLQFAISQLNMKELGPGQPLQFDATLVNPKPVGDIQSRGFFGPLDQEAPRDTPVQGSYAFSHADLSTIKGIGGILSSTGEYSGTLGNIVVQGSTDTPDFRIAISGHPVPLHTEFEAVVDGTSGNTYLRPVRATFLRSSLTANGSIVRVTSPHGHDINLDVVLDHAHIEDLLQLGVRTDPPYMTGAVEMKTKLNLPPGERSVADRLKLAGRFHVPEAHFSSEKVQSKLDSLSLISQGKPKQAHEHLDTHVPADLRGVFTLESGRLAFSFLHFLIPGTHVDMTGVYSLDGQTFDFHGTAKLQATLSEMTTGWKSILLKTVDPFFRKDGAGTEIPIRISGTQAEPHFGLDFGRKDKKNEIEKNEAGAEGH
jgi:hypothetical protein